MTRITPRMIHDACAQTGLCVFPCADHTGDVNDMDTMSMLANQINLILQQQSDMKGTDS